MRSADAGIKRPAGPHDERPVDAAELPALVRPFTLEDVITVLGAASADHECLADMSVSFLYAPNILQDVVDYRSLLRRWHRMLRIGGRLSITVPHAHLCERALALPVAAFPARKRLYTPASLLAEVEEALEPNSYRIRLLCDDDEGYEYAGTKAPLGGQAIMLVIERITLPDWAPAVQEVEPAPPPDFAFEPGRLRHEIVARAPWQRIVILKLDHLGDFIMSLPSLERARSAFAGSEITLVVGSWNVQMARELQMFEHVVGFDAFPRNSSEETVDLAARVSEFERLITGDYDLAIDLRTDPDTRFFLKFIHASVRAGIGTRAQFDFLDIFLPIDGTRHGFEAASVELINHGRFSSSAICQTTAHRIAYRPKDERVDDSMLIWGPYINLHPGEYIFRPKIDIDDGIGILYCDVVCDLEITTEAIATSSAMPDLRFEIRERSAHTEFRFQAFPGHVAPAFSFFGGTLYRRGASSVLHQSEYLSLLIELIALRMDRFGILQDATCIS